MLWRHLPSDTFPERHGSRYGRRHMGPHRRLLPIQRVESLLRDVHDRARNGMVHDTRGMLARRLVRGDSHGVDAHADSPAATSSVASAEPTAAGAAAVTAADSPASSETPSYAAEAPAATVAISAELSERATVPSVAATPPFAFATAATIPSHIGAVAATPKSVPPRCGDCPDIGDVRSVQHIRRLERRRVESVGADVLDLPDERHDGQDWNVRRSRGRVWPGHDAQAERPSRS